MFGIFLLTSEKNLWRCATNQKAHTSKQLTYCDYDNTYQL